MTTLGQRRPCGIGKAVLRWTHDIDCGHTPVTVAQCYVAGLFTTPYYAGAFCTCRLIFNVFNVCYLKILRNSMHILNESAEICY
jgi:hypothetical protein